MDGHKRQRHHAVERIDLLLPLLVEAVRALGSLVVGIAERLLVAFGQHHGDEVVGAGRHLVDGDVLHAGLLDAHVDDLRGVAGKRQVGGRLRHEQAHDERHRELAVFEVADYAHAPSPPFPSWKSATLRRMRTRLRTSSSPT